MVLGWQEQRGLKTGCSWWCRFESPWKTRHVYICSMSHSLTPNVKIASVHVVMECVCFQWFFLLGSSSGGSLKRRHTLFLQIWNVTRTLKGTCMCKYLLVYAETKFYFYCCGWAVEPVPPKSVYLIAVFPLCHNPFLLGPHLCKVLRGV